MLCSFLKASSWTQFAHITKHKWWDLDACLSVQAFSFHVFLAALPAAMTEVLVGIIWSQIAFKTTEQNNPSRLIFQESSAQIQTQVHAYCSPIRHNRSVKICILEQGDKEVLEDCRAPRTACISGATPPDQRHFSIAFLHRQSSSQSRVNKWIPSCFLYWFVIFQFLQRLVRKVCVSNTHFVEAV